MCAYCDSACIGAYDSWSARSATRTTEVVCASLACDQLVFAPLYSACGLRCESGRQSPPCQSSNGEFVAMIRKSKTGGLGEVADSGPTGWIARRSITLPHEPVRPSHPPPQTLLQEDTRIRNPLAAAQLLRTNSASEIARGSRCRQCIK
jgi:hypothetical protein